MFDHRPPRVRVLCALAASCASVLAGCGNGPSTAGSRGPGTSPSGQVVTYTAQQLRAALLTTLDGAGPAVPVQVGRYGSLQGVQTTRVTMRGVRVSPARCARAMRTGLDSAALAGVPATVVSFRDRSGGVSEVLLAPPGNAARQALGHPVPRRCAHYRAMVGGRVFAYSVRDLPAPRLGAAAREMNCTLTAARASTSGPSSTGRPATLARSPWSGTPPRARTSSPSPAWPTQERSRHCSEHRPARSAAGRAGPWARRQSPGKGRNSTGCAAGGVPRGCRLRSLRALVRHRTLACGLWRSPASRSPLISSS